ncbi:hypothetical protein JCM3766R1_000987 [Sporobolomyces carnicolor]
MLVKTALAISLAALATAAPLSQQEGRRQIDLSKRSDIVNVDVGTTIGKNSGANVGAVVAGNGDITADVDAKLGHLLGLDANVSLGLGKLLKGLLGGLLGKRDIEFAVAELAKRADIVNANVGAQIGKNSGANVGAVVSGSGDITADVDAQLGHLLSLDTNLSLGLGKLLRGLLGGLLGKREFTSEELYKRANDDLVDVNLGSTIGKNSHADASVTVGKSLDTEVDADVKLGHLLSLDANASLGLGKLLRGLLGIHHKRALVDSDVAALLNEHGLATGVTASVGSAINAGVGAIATAEGVAAGVKGNVGQIVTDTEATLTKEGLNLGSYVATDKSVVGAGLLSSKDGIDAGVVAKLGNLLGVKVDAKTTPILRGLLGGLLHKN